MRALTPGKQGSYHFFAAAVNRVVRSAERRYVSLLEKKNEKKEARAVCVFNCDLKEREEEGRGGGGGGG